jgi:hypothetical protein
VAGFRVLRILGSKSVSSVDAWIHEVPKLGRAQRCIRNHDSWMTLSFGIGFLLLR